MRITARLLKDIGKMLDKYSRFHPSPLSIKQFIDFDGAETQPGTIVVPEESSASVCVLSLVVGFLIGVPHIARCGRSHAPPTSAVVR
ncbi:hypothetical protein HPB51_010886 [Rhipicephalus microplus]|uniref:Uncharacterized protein n=1 Tax=Rhipicephalus microplus TaxID=6941 RepID=A0A9J6DMA1_RHIMP|nr:hypothetical protein HPB51_010886 [Rhipicephalus microplus]